MKRPPDFSGGLFYIHIYYVCIATPEGIHMAFAGYVPFLELV